MQKKLLNLYADSAGAFLLAVALLLFLGNLGSATLLQPRDPVLMISLRSLCWGAGLGALVLALLCLFVRSLWLKLALLLWAGVNLLIWQSAIYYQTHHWSLSGYFGILENAFHLPGSFSDWIAKMATGGLILGSSLSIFWLWTKNTLKVACPHCGGRIAFDRKNLGQEIPCPHCQKILTLHKAESLKMPCFFCKENIEFPAHALGQKIPCPHCKMDITLKEPV
jgi:hypothetical protein